MNFSEEVQEWLDLGSSPQQLIYDRFPRLYRHVVPKSIPRKRLLGCPFSDGNGRIGRVLSTHFLNRENPRTCRFSIRVGYHREKF
jgi:hypothetical protein